MSITNCIYPALLVSGGVSYCAAHHPSLEGQGLVLCPFTCFKNLFFLLFVIHKETNIPSTSLGGILSVCCSLTVICVVKLMMAFLNTSIISASLLKCLQCVHWICALSVWDITPLAEHMQHCRFMGLQAGQWLLWHMSSFSVSRSWSWSPYRDGCLWLMPSPCQHLSDKSESKISMWGFLPTTWR